MSQNQLKLTIDIGEFAVALIGRLTVEGFAGHGAGWFSADEILEFCESIKQMVNQKKGPVALSTNRTKGYECHETFSLKAYFVSKTGDFAIHSILSEAPYSDCRSEEVLTIMGEVKTSSVDLLTFADTLKQLCLGEVEEVILKAKM